MLHKEDFERIGVVGRTHGIHGEVSMKLSVDISGLLEEERVFLMLEEQGLLIPYAIEAHRSKAGDVDLVRLAGIGTKETAERLTGLSVWLDKAYIGDDELSEDPHDWSRYIGYTVYDAETMATIGSVVDVDDSTLNVLLLIETEADEELMLPIAEELLEGFDDTEHRLVLRIPQGLLDDSAPYDIH